MLALKTAVHQLMHQEPAQAAILRTIRAFGQRVTPFPELIPNGRTHLDPGDQFLHIS